VLERVAVVVDEAGTVARAVGMPEPRDGGFPVGYAVIDSQADVRYATLDPRYLEHGFELDTVTAAVR
jgi:alkyl hydroperoxide reductase subunit AhpC